MELSNASAVVTGGASGLGEATARALVKRGVRVVIADLNEKAGRELAAELAAEFCRTDVTNADEVRDAVDAAVALAPLRVLVCCAGVGFAGRTIGRDGAYESAHPLEAFDRVIRINLSGTFNCARLAATAMSRNEPDDDGQRGAIVNTASIAAFDGQIGQAAYSASKGGIVGLTLPLARDLAAVGIRVNTIAPGLIDTPIYGRGEGSAKFKEHLAKDVVFPKRLGAASEFASLAIELLSNGYMNGETVRLDAAIRLPPK
jgi:NAD(P)-dependent dehydrogenase (short-subunit alcohol dehydrogenase family)